MAYRYCLVVCGCLLLFACQAEKHSQIIHPTATSQILSINGKDDRRIRSVNNGIEERVQAPVFQLQGVEPSRPTAALSARLFRGNRTALVIGNGAYETSRLNNPTNDSNDMTIALKKLGFQVIKLENGSQKQMEDAIRQFGVALRKQDGVGLFFYAGHGMQIDGRNYLIPMHSGIRQETDVKYKAVDVNQVLEVMNAANNDLNLVFLDACRDNPFLTTFRSTSRGFARVDAPAGTLISYSTSPGQVAEDGKFRNGVYTRFLLQNLATMGITVERMLKKVRIAVRVATNGRQTPWESSSLVGDFYFAGK